MLEFDRLQAATNPFAQPTAMSLGESQQMEVESVEGGLASKAGAWTLTMNQSLIRQFCKDVNGRTYHTEPRYVCCST